MVNATGQIGLPPIQVSPLGYTGSPLNFVPITSAGRDPTTLDIGYPTGCEWTNTITLDVWKLLGFISGAADWVKMAAGSIPGGTVVSLSDTVGGGTKVFPDGTGNISLTGTAGQITVTSNPGTNNLNFSLTEGSIIHGLTPDAHTAPGTSPVIADNSGLVAISGNAVAAATIPVRTDSLAANTLTIEVQRTSTSAATNATQQGLASFNSAQFTADASGWVNLAGGSTPPILGVVVDAHTAPGTAVVVPSSGNITVTGAQVAPSAVGANVIRTDSLAANTYTIEIQQSGTAASKDTTKNGVAHFNSAEFTNDQGFISLVVPSPLSTVAIQTFTSSGTYTPTSGMKYCIIELVGGGGGGGGTTTTGVGEITTAGGGGAGGYARKLASAAAIGASQTVTIGAGGSAGAVGGGNGGAGGTTSLGTLCIATGGGGGFGGPSVAQNFSSAYGGTAGIGTTGDFLSRGSYGVNGTAGLNFASNGGAGGSSFFGGGGQGATTSGGPTNGDPGSNYGGGGGAGATGSGGQLQASGGAGSAGVIIVTEYI